MAVVYHPFHAVPAAAFEQEAQGKEPLRVDVYGTQYIRTLDGVWKVRVDGYMYGVHEYRRAAAPDVAWLNWRFPPPREAA